MEAVHKERLGKVTIKIIPDDSGSTDSPFDSSDESVRFVEWNRHGHSDSWNEKRRDWSPADALEWAKRERFLVYPVFKYEHGGVAYSLGAFSCPWDSGQCGFLFLSRKEWKRKSKKADSYAKGAIADFSSWANGEVYGFVIEDDNGEELDSCWGFIGDSDYCLEEAKGQAAYFSREIEEREARELLEANAAKAEAFEAACYAGRPDLAPQWEAAA